MDTIQAIRQWFLGQLYSENGDHPHVRVMA